MTQKTTLPISFTGANVANLPKFVTGTPVPSGLIRRYSVESLDSSLVGTAITSLTDLTGSSAVLTQPTASKRPTLRELNGQRYLEFDGVDDELSAGSVGSGVRTIAAVVRYRAGLPPTGDNWPVLALAGGGGGAYSLAPGSNMIAYVSSGISNGIPGTSTHVFLAVLNGASSVARMDDLEAAGNTGNLTTGANMHVGKGTGSGWAKIDGYEWLVWDRALTLDERTKVAKDLRTKYGF